MNVVTRLREYAERYPKPTQKAAHPYVDYGVWLLVHTCRIRRINGKVFIIGGFKSLQVPLLYFQPAAGCRVRPVSNFRPTDNS